MNKKISIILGLFFIFAAIFTACKEEEYTMGDLTKPSNLVITTTLTGQNTANPYGDGSGVVNIVAKANNALAYKIGYSVISKLDNNLELIPVPNTAEGLKVVKKFTENGEVAYRITVVAYGKGGTSTVATKDITVKYVYEADPTIVTNLTGNASKTWKVDQSVAGHFGVGPWSPSSLTPEWWAAAVNEKVACCNCFYTARFTFKQIDKFNFSLQLSTPDGAFTKTGSLASVTGIPASGDEGCYGYGGGASVFKFMDSTSGIVGTAENPTTGTSIVLEGNNTYIGYGSLKKEYEIMQITPDYMYLRVQGTETGNAWYIKLIPAL